MRLRSPPAALGISSRHRKRDCTLADSPSPTPSPTQVVGCGLPSGTAAPKLSVLDAHGCSPQCACSSGASGASEFVVGRSEGVYFYGSDGRGQCLAFPGEKRQLAAFGGYLMVLAGGPPGTVASSQARFPSFAAAAAAASSLACCRQC